MNNITSLHKNYLDRKLNVCAYCRISNNKDELETSLVEQIEYYSDLILSNYNWKFAGIFADDGISGTTINQRKQFQIMLDKALNGSIDIIITKSISRFARNVTDLLSTVHELKTKGVEIIFERENFSTLDMKSDTMLTIYAKFAEDEAKSVSQNVKWRNQVNMQNGDYHINTSQLLGYAYDENKQVVIVENEAKWIRKIFEMYTQEIPVRQIGEFLKQNKVLTALGSIDWNSRTIRNILKNEKYVGDCLMQKSFVIDPLTHERLLNKGELPQALIRNGHPAIVDRKTWTDAQKLMESRCKKFKIAKGRGVHSQTKWTSFLYCPYCGRNYIMTKSRSTKRQILVDSSNRETLVCLESQSIYVDVLERAIVEQINILLANITNFKKSLTVAVETNKAINEQESQENATQADIEALQERLKHFKSLESEANAMAIYKIKEKLKELIKKRILLQNNSLIAYNPFDKIKQIMNCLKKHTKITSIDDIDFKEIFSRIIVYKRDHIVFVVGNSDCSKIKRKAKTILNGSIEYKQRATTYKTNFGIYINF